MLPLPQSLGRFSMVKRGFILIITLVIALQSMASIVNEGQLYHGDTDHLEHSHPLADSDNDDSATKPSPDSQEHASDHCHHNHNCFHQVLMGGLADVFGITANITRFGYEANFTTGAQTTPFRPPIS